MDSPDWPNQGIPFIGPAKNYTRGRPYGPPIVGMFHATANTATPIQEAQYAQRENPASSHLYAGDATPSLVQSVPIGSYAWHAGGAFGNRRGVAIELCGQPSWSRSTWTKDMRDVQACALAIRLINQAAGIRMRWLTKAQFLTLYNNRTIANSGWVTHAQYNAWSPDSGSDHTDPGPGCPLDLIMQLAIQGGDTVDVADIMGAKYKEYIDQDGNGVRDPRTFADIVWSTHSQAVQAQRASARIEAELAEAKKRDEASAAAVATLGTALNSVLKGGTSVDTAALLTRIDQVGAAESARVQQLQAEVESLHEQLARASAAAAAALQG